MRYGLIPKPLQNFNRLDEDTLAAGSPPASRTPSNARPARSPIARIARSRKMTHSALAKHAMMSGLTQHVDFTCSIEELAKINSQMDLTDKRNAEQHEKLQSTLAEGHKVQNGLEKRKAGAVCEHKKEVQAWQKHANTLENLRTLICSSQEKTVNSTRDAAKKLEVRANHFQEVAQQPDQKICEWASAAAELQKEQDAIASKHAAGLDALRAEKAKCAAIAEKQRDAESRAAKAKVRSFLRRARRGGGT